MNASADCQGAEDKNRHALDGGFFSYRSSVFSNTDATAIRCLKNIFQIPS